MLSCTELLPAHHPRPSLIAFRVTHSPHAPPPPGDRAVPSVREADFERARRRVAAAQVLPAAAHQAMVREYEEFLMGRRGAVGA